MYKRKKKWQTRGSVYSLISLFSQRSNWNSVSAKAYVSGRASEGPTWDWEMQPRVRRQLVAQTAHGCYWRKWPHVLDVRVFVQIKVGQGGEHIEGFLFPTLYVYQDEGKKIPFRWVWTVFSDSILKRKQMENISPTPLPSSTASHLSIF